VNHVLKPVIACLLLAAWISAPMVVAQYAPPLPEYVPTHSLPELVPALYGDDLVMISQLKDQLPQEYHPENIQAIQRLLNEAVYHKDKTPVSNARLFHIVSMQGQYGFIQDTWKTLSLINPTLPEGETLESLGKVVYDFNDKTNWANEVFLKDMQLKAMADWRLASGQSGDAVIAALHIVSIHERDQVLLDILYRQCYTARRVGKFDSMIKKATFTFSRLSENARDKGIEHIKDAYFYAVDLKPTP